MGNDLVLADLMPFAPKAVTELRNHTFVTGTLATRGDLLTHDGTTETSLAIGTAGRFLRTNSAGTDPAWEASFALRSVDNTDSPVTVALSDNIFFITGSAITFNLPAAATAGHKVYTFKRADAGASNITIDPSASEQIEGASTFVMGASISGQAAFQSVSIATDGTAWWVVSDLYNTMLTVDDITWEGTQSFTGNFSISNVAPLLSLIDSTGGHDDWNIGIQNDDFFIQNVDTDSGSNFLIKNSSGNNIFIIDSSGRVTVANVNHTLSAFDAMVDFASTTTLTKGAELGFVAFHFNPTIDITAASTNLFGSDFVIWDRAVYTSSVDVDWSGGGHNAMAVTPDFTNTGTGDVTYESAKGMLFSVSLNETSSGSLTMQKAIAVDCDMGITGLITNATTLELLTGLHIGDVNLAGAGAVTVQTGMDIDAVTGADEVYGIRSALTADALRLFIKHTGTAESLFGGKIAFVRTDLNEYITSDANETLDLHCTTSMGFHVGATEEMILTQNLLTFKDGGSDMSIGWAIAANMIFNIGATPEMVLSGDNLTFNNGSNDMRLDWATDGVLIFDHVTTEVMRIATGGVDVAATLRCEVIRADSSAGGSGAAGTTTMTGDTDTPTASLDWSTVGAPTGYFKFFDDTSAVVVPFWTT